MRMTTQLVPRAVSGALLLALGLALTSCGGSDDSQENPARAAEAFYHAMGEKDFQNACTLVTDDSGETLTEESPDFDQCVTFMNRFFLAEVDSSDLEWFRNVEVRQATVDGDSATVTKKDMSPHPPSGSDDELSLSRVDGKWYVDLD